MAAVIIESKNPEHLKIFTAMAKQLGDSVKPIDLSDAEDLFLGNFMNKIKTGKTVSRASVMKTLGVK